MTNGTRKLENVTKSGTTYDGTGYTVKGNKITVDPIEVDSGGMAKETYFIDVFIENTGSWYCNNKYGYLYSSSNELVASIIYDYSEMGISCFTICINKPGKANITITANDGTNKKITLSISSTAKK